MSTDVGGRPSITAVKVVVGSTPTQIVATRQGRKGVIVVQEGTVDVRYGIDSTVAIATGALLPGVVGASLNLEYCGPLWGISGSSATVSVTEVFG